VQKSALKDTSSSQNPFAEPAETHRNLYIRQIDKDLPTEQVRIAFASFGKIASFKMMCRPKYRFNIAYVMYYESEHAKRAFDMVRQYDECFENLKVDWFKPRQSQADDMLNYFDDNKEIPFSHLQKIRHQFTSDED